VSPHERTALDDAKEFLREELADGLVMAKQVFKDAREAGHAEITVRRAKTELRVQSEKQGSEGWAWRLSTTNVITMIRMSMLIIFDKRSQRIPLTQGKMIVVITGISKIIFALVPISVRTTTPAARAATCATPSTPRERQSKEGWHEIVATDKPTPSAETR
jgi:hypothetical protein